MRKLRISITQSAWCHLGNIGWRLGGKYDRHQAEGRLKGFQPWNDVIDDFHNHLEANEINANYPKIKLGSLLELDGETFTGPSATPEALSLLTREYRKGYEVPNKV